jgi:protein ImuB
LKRHLMARILSLWSPRWAIDVWRRKISRKDWRGDAPAALVITECGTRRLYAVSAGASDLGLFPGQKAADAAGLVPELALAEADPAGDLAALNRLAEWASRFSPAVAPDAPDGLLLDITGLAHLWGGEGPLIEDLLARLESEGVHAQAAVADTPGAAWALARFAPPRTIAAPGEGVRRLAALPVRALRLEDHDAAQLARLGITRIGHLTALPRAQVTRRFGAGVLLRLDQALGAAPQGLKFRRPPSPWFERLCLVEPIATPEDIARIAADLAGLICRRLEGAGRGARRFEFAFHRVDGGAQRVELGLSAPGREVSVLMRLIRPKLEFVDPGFGIEAASVTARAATVIAASQSDFAGGENQAAKIAVAALIDSLASRLGEDKVWRPVPVQSHEPERAQGRVRAGSGQGEGQDKAGGWDRDLPRPVRLFSRPEPVEATAPLPDDPPVLFRWRGRLHRVRRAEGPERIAREWWRIPIDDVACDQVRDYYRVEDETGARFWLFRAGLHGAGYQPKWWMHGLFG